MPTPTLEELIAAKNAVSPQLLDPSFHADIVSRGRALRLTNAVAYAGRNVHAVGVGPKIVGGKATEDLCIRLYVIQKLPDTLLAPVFRLPKEFDGLPTDIIESPPSFLFVARRSRASSDTRKQAVAASNSARRKNRAKAKATALSVVDVVTFNPTKPQRPLMGGVSAANADVLGGTLGYFCRSLRPADNPETVYLLSNYHVFGDRHGAVPETTILQPSSGDGGMSVHRVAVYARGVPLTPNGESSVDAAVASCLPGIQFEPRICELGQVSGVKRATKGGLVRKYGRSTRQRTGVITDLSHNAIVGMDPGDLSTIVRLNDQVRIEPQSMGPMFAESGDSGSLVMEADTQNAVGLLCGGDVRQGRWAIANHLDNVLKELKIALI